VPSLTTFAVVRQKIYVLVYSPKMAINMAETCSCWYCLQYTLRCRITLWFYL